MQRSELYDGARDLQVDLRNHADDLPRCLQRQPLSFRLRRRARRLPVHVHHDVPHLRRRVCVGLQLAL